MFFFTRNKIYKKIEIFIYFAVYIIYIIIGLWKIIALREQILNKSKFEFASGWSILQRPRDDSNDELENFTGYMRTSWHWYLLHTCISTITRQMCPALICHGYIACAILALLGSLELISVALFFMLLISFYLTAQMHSKRLIWLLAGVWMLIINIIKNSHYWYEQIGYTEYFTLIIVLSWSLLRCCSYALSSINEKEAQSEHNLVNFLAYTMYYPCLAYGPFISYKRFRRRTTAHSSELGLQARRFGWALLRVYCWWLCMQLALHFFYIHYMARDVSTVALIGSVFWQHAAGYFMGQFFFLYYVITYGLGIAFAHYDGIDAPNRPRCIGRIHFYSDMWKYFDEGLYEFLFGHIYAELCGKRSSAGAKFFATAVTFGFVFVWHGCYTYVLIWSVLNFICLAAEKIFKTGIESKWYQHWCAQHLGAEGAQRLYALLATQLFIPAAFSNVYFISGQEVGDFLMRGAYLSGPWNYLALCFCSYCFFQCSELLLNKRKLVDIKK